MMPVGRHWRAIRVGGGRDWAEEAGGGGELVGAGGGVAARAVGDAPLCAGRATKVRLAWEVAVKNELEEGVIGGVDEEGKSEVGVRLEVAVGYGSMG